MSPPNNFVTSLTYLSESYLSLDTSWQQLLWENCSTELTVIDGKLSELAKTQTIYPPPSLIFNALLHTPLNELKIVILGQDPYHGENEANGLAFAVNSGVKLPPSLRNIYQELALEYGINPKNLTGDQLVKWADQGVLLLNACLTVVKDQANSLAKLGWHYITDMLIHQISITQQNLVFILWGNFAKEKAKLIDQNKHLVLTGVHPSPLSAHRGFFGCNHFKLANLYLVNHGYLPINWI